MAMVRGRGRSNGVDTLAGASTAPGPSREARRPRSSYRLSSTADVGGAPRPLSWVLIADAPSRRCQATRPGKLNAVVRRDYVAAARSAPSRGGPPAPGTYFRAVGSRSSLV